MEDDWDLHAVVRGCSALTTNTTATSSSATATTSTNATSFGQVFSNSFHQDYNNNKNSSSNNNFSCFQDLFEPPPRREELHELFKPFYFKSSESSQIAISPQSLPISSPLSVLGGLQDLSSSEQQIVKQPQQTQIRQQKQPSFSVTKTTVSHHPTTRSKRRKNIMKRVCHVSAENLSSDVWSWRKYGQKPIKGSPYPRGYYRCSTSKGCLARKQVERNRSDPGMFIVTYTAEHNHPMPTHRNSLAGTSRHKPAPETPNSGDCSPPASPSSAPEKLESSRDDPVEDDDDAFSVSKMELDDDFFAGLDDLTAPEAGECNSGHFLAAGEFGWFSSSATTIAGSG